MGCTVIITSPADNVRKLTVIRMIFRICGRVDEKLRALQAECIVGILTNKTNISIIVLLNP